ncbi:MAG: ATP-binding cassette domain-containing protein [Acidimicrobiia bacterium]|nr:ATP-binding cassette domain-containing protein [Acidimicrobiia bacterium]
MRPASTVVAVSPVLEALDVSVRFGGVDAVDRVNLDLRPGELAGLIGPNGAGKTSTVDALTGFVAHRGRVVVAGVDVTGRSPHERARRGLSRTWQSGELFDDLTIAENGRVAARARRRGGPDDPATAVGHALELVGLADVADRYPGELPLGHRKLAGLARALVARPRVVLLDEPAAGLDTAETERLGGTLRRIVDAGTDVLLIDHDMGLVLGICDRVHVLDFGRVVASGPPSAIREDPVVISAYLGQTPPAGTVAP